jgi:hypothetical protein
MVEGGKGMELTPKNVEIWNGTLTRLAITSNSGKGNLFNSKGASLSAIKVSKVHVLKTP